MRLVKLVTQVARVSLVPQGQQGRLVVQELLVFMDLQVRQEPLDLLAQQVFRVAQVPQEVLGQLERRV